MNIRSFAVVTLFVAAFLAFMTGFARADDRFPPRDMAVHKVVKHQHHARHRQTRRHYAARTLPQRRRHVAQYARQRRATLAARARAAGYARRHPPHQPVIIPRPWRAVGSGRPAGCPPRNWCGCFMTKLMGIPDRALWLARNWAKVGVPAGGPRVGAIVVWRHHVGRVTAVDGNRIRVLSGNDGRRVRDRWRSTRGVIAYRVAAR